MLRLLQDQTFQRVGGNETIRTDVRVIAATNKDLAALVEAGRFRQDLFYRLNGFTIHVPPLRQRREDIPLLVDFFMIALAGGRNAADDLHQAWGEYGAESLLRAQPDVIVSDPSVHLESALGREPWRSLRAVREGRVYVVEPASILEQPGTHYTEGLQWLIDRLVPLAS